MSNENEEFEVLKSDEFNSAMNDNDFIKKIFSLREDHTKIKEEFLKEKNLNLSEASAEKVCELLNLAERHARNSVKNAAGGISFKDWLKDHAIAGLFTVSEIIISTINVAYAAVMLTLEFFHMND